MVEHVCNKCRKIFYRKDLYKKHLNRKFPCIDKELHVSKQEKLEIKVNKLEEEIEQLKLLIQKKD